MASNDDFSGIWRSKYTYKSSGRAGDFTSEYLVKVFRRGDWLTFETVPDVSNSYLLIRVHMDDNVATGTWQEQTNNDSYYKGAVYHGAIQFIIEEGRHRLRGKWVGFGKNLEVNTGPWELTYIGETVPAVDRVEGAASPAKR